MKTLGLHYEIKIVTVHFLYNFSFLNTLNKINQKINKNK